VGGFGYETMQGRLRFGFEGGLHREVQDNRLVDGNLETTAQSLLGRVGAEYFLTNRFIIRGGYVRSAWDTDLDAPRTLLIGDEMTIGVGYSARGGLIQFDAALRLLDYVPDYEGDPRLEQSCAGFSLGARFLL